MEQPWIDSVAKALASGISRRTALRRLGTGIAVVALAPFLSLRDSNGVSAQQTCPRGQTCDEIGPDSGNDGGDDVGPGDSPGCEPGEPNCVVICRGEQTQFVCLAADGSELFTADCAGGQEVVVRCRELGGSAGQAPLLGLRRLQVNVPVGLRQVMAVKLQLQPLETPNFVNLTLHYTDEQVQGVAESGLRAFYFHDGLSAWVEMPSVVNPPANSVTMTHVDVSAFADALHDLGLFV